MDCSLPSSSVHGILQARILEWVAISFSRGSSPPRYWTLVSILFQLRHYGSQYFIYVCMKQCEYPGSCPSLVLFPNKLSLSHLSFSSMSWNNLVWLAQTHSLSQWFTNILFSGTPERVSGYIHVSLEHNFENHFPLPISVTSTSTQTWESAWT